MVIISLYIKMVIISLYIVIHQESEFNAIIICLSANTRLFGNHMHNYIVT